MCVYQQCCVTTSDVSYVRRCNALITFGNYYHLYQLQAKWYILYCHFHHFDLLFVLNLMSHFVLTNSFVYMLYQQCRMYLKRRFTYHFLQLLSLVSFIKTIIQVKFICSSRFHNFDPLSVLSCCVVFVQSIVITPKRPLFLRSTVFFCVLHFRCMVYNPRPLWIAWEVNR